MLSVLMSDSDEKEEKSEAPTKTRIFTFKTTVGQEQNVAGLIKSRGDLLKIPIYAIMVTESLRGYVFVETISPNYVDDVTAGIKHAKQRLPGLLKLSDLERYIITKPIIEDLNSEDTIEVIGGPFKGMKAKITRVDRSKNEVTLELLEAAVALPITIHADYVRLISRAEGSE